MRETGEKQYSGNLVNSKPQTHTNSQSHTSVPQVPGSRADVKSHFPGYGAAPGQFGGVAGRPPPRVKNNNLAYHPLNAGVSSNGNSAANINASDASKRAISVDGHSFAWNFTPLRNNSRSRAPLFQFRPLQRGPSPSFTSFGPELMSPRLNSVLMNTTKETPGTRSSRMLMSPAVHLRNMPDRALKSRTSTGGNPTPGGMSGPMNSGGSAGTTNGPTNGLTSHSVREQGSKTGASRAEGRHTTQTTKAHEGPKMSKSTTERSSKRLHKRTKPQGSREDAKEPTGSAAVSGSGAAAKDTGAGVAGKDAGASQKDLTAKDAPGESRKSGGDIAAESKNAVQAQGEVPTKDTKTFSVRSFKDLEEESETTFTNSNAFNVGPTSSTNKSVNTVNTVWGGSNMHMAATSSMVQSVQPIIKRSAATSQPPQLKLFSAQHRLRLQSCGEGLWPKPDEKRVAPANPAEKEPHAVQGEPRGFMNQNMQLPQTPQVSSKNMISRQSPILHFPRRSLGIPKQIGSIPLISPREQTGARDQTGKRTHETTNLGQTVTSTTSANSLHHTLGNSKSNKAGKMGTPALHSREVYKNAQASPAPFLRFSQMQISPPRMPFPTRVHRK